jgi:hypothetical protein
MVFCSKKDEQKPIVKAISAIQQDFSLLFPLATHEFGASRHTLPVAADVPMGTQIPICTSVYKVRQPIEIRTEHEGQLQLITPVKMATLVAFPN